MAKEKVAFVKELHGNEMVDIIEIISKRERKMHVQDLDLIETHGVNVFKLDNEPTLV
jgi:hypothetical protein